MFDLPAVQVALLPFALLYLLLHAGPLFRLWYEPSIRGGTDWRFFASEVVLFSAYLLAAPAIVDHPVGRAALALHLTLHVSFTVADYLAHEFLLGTALTPWRRSRLWWFAKEAGLAIDTLTHAVAVALLAAALGPGWVIAAAPVSVAAFLWVSAGYRRRHGAPAMGR